ESLIFATSAEKALEKFKDELWALDEYAGIRYRDPSDPEQTLLDISLQPNLRPLRRALLARVSQDGGGSLADLRKWVVHATIYRAVDATKAVQALVAAGEVERSPASGRLSPSTVIRPVSRCPSIILHANLGIVHTMLIGSLYLVASYETFAYS